MGLLTVCMYVFPFYFIVCLTAATATRSIGGYLLCPFPPILSVNRNLRSQMTSNFVEVVEVKEVVPITPSLSSFLGPLSTEDFLRGTYQPTRDGNDFESVAGRGGQGLPPKSLVVKLPDTASDEDRAKRLSFLKSHMFNFHPVRMLETSGSMTSGSGVNVWLTPDKSTSTAEIPSKISTLKVDDASKAALLYKSGNSLYFRASDELESEFVPTLLGDLGHSIPSSMFYRDGAKRGEIETFASHIGHTTPWHWDFQENFTVQLRGSKTWYLFAGDESTTIASPHRAMALHFGTASEAVLNPIAFLENCRVQHMQHALHKNASMGRFQGGPPADVLQRCVAVTLQPGDVLYHPAGVWHQVATVPPLHNAGEASLSINVSLFPETYAEHVAEGLYHQMVSQFHWRQRMDCRNYKSNLHQLNLRRSSLMQEGLATSFIQPSELLPPALYSITRPYAAVGNKEGIVTVLPSDSGIAPLAITSVLARNRLTSMTHTSFEPSFRIDVDNDDCAEMCKKLFSLVVRIPPSAKAAPAEHTSCGSDSSEEEEEEEEGAQVAPLQAQVIPLFQTTVKGAKRSRAEAELEKRLKHVARFDVHYNFVGGCDDSPMQDVMHCALFVEGKALRQTLLQWAALPYRPCGISISELLVKDLDTAAQLNLLAFLAHVGFFVVCS